MNGRAPWEVAITIRIEEIGGSSETGRVKDIFEA